MGNTTKRLSSCVGQSSRETRRERPHISRPFWPYEYENHLNLSTHIPSTCLFCETNSIHSSPPTIGKNYETRSMYIVRKTPYS